MVSIECCDHIESAFDQLTLVLVDLLDGVVQKSSLRLNAKAEELCHTGEDGRGRSGGHQQGRGKGKNIKGGLVLAVTEAPFVLVS